MAGVPKFGNWETDGSVPYTQYFEKARIGKGGGKGTPEEGNGSSFDDAPRVRASPARTKEALNPAHAAERYENVPRKTVGWDAGKTHGDSQAAAPRPRSERSVENSPLSQHTPGRLADKAGSASPYQSKVPPERSHDFAPTPPGGPGRTRPQQSDQPEKVTAVPKFGAWDETDPSEGAVYTEVFNRVKDEKNSTRSPYLMKEPDYSSYPPKANSGSWSWLSCFRG